jgi:hypothetical protein
MLNEERREENQILNTYLAQQMQYDPNEKEKKP